MKPVVVTNTPRIDQSIVNRLAELGAATAHEAMGRSGLMKPYLRPVWAGAQVAGSAVTVLAQPGDNWMLHVAVEQCRPGDILVVGVTADGQDTGLALKKGSDPVAARRAARRGNMTGPLLALLILELAAFGGNYLRKRYVESQVIVVPPPATDRSIIT